MADHLEIQPRRAPWSPTADSALGDVFHRYDVPLVGLLTQHGLTYLFSCVAGHVEPVSLWTYTLVGPDDLEALTTCDNPDDFDALTGSIARIGPTTLALAVENQLMSGRSLADWAELRGAVTSLLDQLELWLGSVRGQAVEDTDRLLAECH